MTSSQSLHTLLDQTSWIHALARRLVADPSLADDLAQETCIDALEHEPDGLLPLRGWLATVMRRNLAKLRRGDRNRALRELDARASELEPSAHDVVERAETHRNVVLAVLALDDPYRSTLLMRFFEQLSYDEIARRTGVTRAAVNSRVTRGLEQLRARLETTYGGDRRALCLALTPLAKLPTGVATTLFGVKIMHLAIGTAAATLLAVTVTVGLSGAARTSAPRTAGPVNSAPSNPDSTNDELATPGFFDLPHDAREAVPALAPQDRKHAQQKESDKDVWKAELFHDQALAPTVQSLAVSAGSGNVEVRESQSGRLEIEAKVRALLGTVANSELTQVFEDHVDVIEEEGVLRIEDKHKNSRGWNVSFVARVPGKLPVSANSGSGDVLVRSAKGSVSANTGSGSVRVELPGESIEKLGAKTGSGDIAVEVSAVSGKLVANTGSGAVRVRVADPNSAGAVGANSGSGDILLVVPPGIVGSFDLQTTGDEIDVPRGLGLEVRTDVSGLRRARGTVGSGGGKYKLSSGSGALRIELGNALPARTK